MSRHLQLVGIALAVIFFLVVLYMMHQKDNFYEQFSLISRDAAHKAAVSSREMTDPGTSTPAPVADETVTQRPQGVRAAATHTWSFAAIFFEYAPCCLAELPKAVLNPHASRPFTRTTSRRWCGSASTGGF